MRRTALGLIFLGCACSSTDNIEIMGVGKVESSFGNNGFVTEQIGSAQNQVRTLVIDSQKRIYAVGWSGDAMALVRYTASGERDQSFGAQGQVIQRDGNDEALTAHDALIDASGRLVVVGTAGDAVNLMLARYTSSGTLDDTFGVGGIVSLDVATELGNQAFSSDVGLALAPDAQGLNYFLGGTSNLVNGSGDFSAIVVKISAIDGTVDTTWGEQGYGTVSFASSSPTAGIDEQLMDVAVHDGRVLLASTAFNGMHHDFSVARLDATGVLDTDFGVGGTAAVDFGGAARLQAMVVDQEGRILLGGYVSDGSLFDVALARLNSDGQRDAVFGNNGIAVLDYDVDTQGSSFLPELMDGRDGDLLLDEDGRIYFCGTQHGFADLGSPVVLRLGSSGTLDADFGRAGYLAPDTQEGTARSLVFLDDQTLLVGGQKGANSDRMFSLVAFSLTE